MSESILTTMTTAFSGPEAAFEWKLLYRFFGLLAQTGTPVSLETLAQALACERSQVAQVLDEQYPEAEYDESGKLVGVGLTLRPTVHQLVVENRPFYTWCAPDALHIAVVLGRPAQIISRCPITGTRIEVTLTPERMTAFTPASAVVSFPKHGNTLKRLKEAGCIRQGGCQNALFFASGEAAAPWVSHYADFRVFPLEEAFEDLREFAHKQMALATRA